MFDFEKYVNDAVFSAATCLQWQASDDSEENYESYPIGEEGDEYTEAVADIIREQVEDFIRANAYLLGRSNVTAEQAGHNLILTANHHGSGFWDCGYEDGEELTEAAHPYSFEASFALDYEGNVAWLCVESNVLVNRTREAFGEDWTG